MRIIGGKLKGHKLKGIGKRTTRAITDRVKESIFDILGDVSGRRVLDLFAGTGSLGIEALSRGAREVVFIDCDRGCVKTIRRNLSTLGLKAHIYGEDIGRGLRKLPAKEFDLIFVDPPFKSNLAEQTLENLNQFKLIASEGVVVVRHHSKKSQPERVGGLKLSRREKYGENIVCFYNLD